MAFGLTATGFVPKTVEIILDELREDWKNTFGQSSLGPLIDKFLGIIAEREANVWELAESVNDGQNPDTALKAALEAVCAITGTTRDPATKSTITMALIGDDSTVVASGSRASVTGTDEEFESTAGGTITDVTTWATTTAYVVGNRRYNDTPDRVYECTVAGTSAGSGGPTGTGTGITDNTVTWNYLGDGQGAIDVAGTSVNTGPVVAVARDLNTIETPVSGWSDVINVLDAVPGENVEADEDLRIRREDELSSGGKATNDAIRAALLDVKNVTDVKLFVNNTDTTDGDGLLPHAIEALIQGGTDQALFDALLATVASGIQTFGTESGTADDAEGSTFTMKFSRPAVINIYVDIELTYDADTYPSDGDTQVEAAVIKFGDGRGTGFDAVASALSSAIFKDVSGILDVTVLDIGLSADPSSDVTLPITTRELADYDTSRTTVVSVAGTP